MKKRYELQYWGWETHRWCRSIFDGELLSLDEKCGHAKKSPDGCYRLVQKLGRKVIKVIYPKGK